MHIIGCILQISRRESLVNIHTMAGPGLMFNFTLCIANYKQTRLIVVLNDNTTVGSGLSVMHNQDQALLILAAKLADCHMHKLLSRNANLS